MNIGIDVDEVVCDLLSVVLDSMDSKWGLKSTVDVFSDYNFFANSYTACDKTNKDIAEDLIRWVNDADYLYRLSPYPDAANTIKELLSVGHQVHFVTARPTNTLMATKKWFDAHDIPYTSLHVIGHGSSKGVLGRELDLNIYIDDHAANIEDVLEHTKAVNFLIDRPYNRWYINNKVTRIDKLQDIHKYINKNKYAKGGNYCGQ